MTKKFKIGETVWVKTDEAGVLKGKVIGYQSDIVRELKYGHEPYPIVQGQHPWEKGKTFKNAFDFDHINKYSEGKYFKQWRFV